MFERVIKELEALQRNKISITVGTDSDGYLDRECPNEDCLFQFKVHKDDWLNIFRDEQVFCPMCRHEANSHSWWTQDQRANAQRQAHKYVHGILGKAFEQGASDFNAKQPRDSFLSIRMSYKGSTRQHYLVPIPASEEMALKIQCQNCQSRYSVVGSAFFCPSCGHNSAEETFENSVRKIEAKIKNLSVIKKAVEEISKDEAETTCRSLIESSLNECVVAFQRFCEVTYLNKRPNEKLKFNAFQNLEIGAEYWKELLLETYSDWLTKSQMTELNELFQKRHLLSHTEGIVDNKYIQKSGDNSYKVGQRLVIKEKDVLHLTSLITMIVTFLREKLNANP